MKLIGLKEKAEAGQWFVAARSEDGTEKVELLIRAVPTAKLRELGYRLLGRKRVVKIKQGGQELDVPKNIELAVAKACYALIDSKNLDVDALTAEDATVLADATGRSVNAGDTVRMDGKWSQAAKQQVLSDPQSEDLVAWICKKADSQVLTIDDEEDEAELGKT